jgi:hypothetical protein
MKIPPPLISPSLKLIQYKDIKIKQGISLQ